MFRIACFCGMAYASATSLAFGDVGATFKVGTQLPDELNQQTNGLGRIVLSTSLYRAIGLEFENANLIPHRKEKKLYSLEFLHVGYSIESSLGPGSLTTTAVLANRKWNLMYSNSLMPYFCVGAGLLFSTLHFNDAKQDVSLALQGTAGIELKLRYTRYLQGEVKYFRGEANSISINGAGVFIGYRVDF